MMQFNIVQDTVAQLDEQFLIRNIFRFGDSLLSGL